MTGINLNFDTFRLVWYSAPFGDSVISPFRYFAITMIQTQVFLVILFNFARWGSRSDFRLPSFNPCLHRYDRQAIPMWVMLSSRYPGDWNCTNTEQQLNASLRSTLSCCLSSSGVNGSQTKSDEEPVLPKYPLRPDTHLGVVFKHANLGNPVCFCILAHKYVHDI